MTRMQALPIEPTSPLTLLPEAPTRAQMEEFGLWLMSLENEHAPPDLCTMHHHAENLYGRSAVIRAGTFLVGLPHKQGALNVCAGDITVWTEQGRQRLTGAHILASDPGAMRVGYAHSDTTWLTVHANLTGSTDERVIEAALVEHPELLLTRRQELQ